MTLPFLSFAGIALAVAQRGSRACAIALAAGLCTAVAAHAQTVVVPPKGAAVSRVNHADVGADTGSLDVTAGQEQLVRLGQNASSVFVANPDIADVHMPTPRVLVVLGKKAGTTTLFVLDANGAQMLKRTLSVGQDLDSLRRMVKARFPDLNLRIDAGPGSLQVSGDAPSAEVANAVAGMVSPYLSDKQAFVNRMTVPSPQQVQLRVRITEVDRTITQQLGINWQSLGLPGHWQAGLFNGRQFENTSAAVNSGQAPFNLSSNGAFSLLAGFLSNRLDLQVMLDALHQEQLLTVLAEPNLVALSGQTASFLAGGEFPIPVSQTNGAIDVEFKQFGVKLDFTPTVLNDHRISLKVRPEVSQIDTSVSVNTNGVTIPGLSVRRADTTVELASGQSFAIAGLLQNNTTDVVSQLPGLGSIPILGKLFSSTNYQNNKTELVIIVTPYLVQPTDPANLRSPLQSVVQPVRDIEYSFQHAFGAGGGSGSGGNHGNGAADDASQPRLVGQAGYIY
ncbi:type II and III secretion system protein family protein [Paraburkholderia caballeronis]|uniref:type II and III secretion system protein family protein n=1 Tax=Paraburkholderia caballeronis TaxID=416943 RepID=UPI0010657F07|nr:type II and III secretion system protein family protein [Paraburkholderia caballeronis]TDV11677.1 pilus assembly protein CpaC [Paraburkholderia caballeronis]TDV14758.1 pilus assembly protein CpaC [Paraburkholderia caballeronis]TDV23878.1 pilus assembly protein CpaC [Paraburkholderia caballeronis]